jgi:hypothetical protein
MYLLAVEFHPIILETAIVSPFFLRFDSVTNAFEETPFQRAIVALWKEIRLFNDNSNPKFSGALAVLFEHSPKTRGYPSRKVTVEPIKIAGLLHLLDRWINIIELCIAIYRYLDGKPFVEPSLRSRSPVEGLAEEIERQSPTIDETLAFINFDHEAHRKGRHSK